MFGLQDVVDEDHRVLGVLGIGQHGGVVHPDRVAGRRIAIGHVRVLQPRAHRRAVPVDPGQDVAGDVIVDRAVIERQPVRLGLHQHVTGGAQDVHVVGAHIVAARRIDRDRHHVGHLGDDVDAANQRFGRIEDDVGGVDVAVIDRGIHGDAGGAPLPRHGVFAARVEIDIDPLRRDVAAVGDDLGIERLQQPLFDPDRHIAVGGHHDIEAMTALTDAGKRRFIRVEIGDRDLDPRIGGELLYQFGAGVIAPVIDVEHPVGMGEARRGQQGQRRNQCLFHVLAPSWLVLLDHPRLRVIRKNAVTNRSDSARNRVAMAFISGVMTRRNWPSM
eukprot:m.11112 g.11112  ORF g.11112 m.11112 type:complete len:330 (-) comp6381_c0_seq1:16-1005(-)